MDMAGLERKIVDFNWLCATAVWMLFGDVYDRMVGSKYVSWQNEDGQSIYNGVLVLH